MSNNTNIQLDEELQDLLEEEVDACRAYTNDIATLKQVKEHYKKSELAWLKSKVALLEFKEKMKNDN